MHVIRDSQKAAGRPCAQGAVAIVHKVCCGLIDRDSGACRRCTRHPHQSDPHKLHGERASTPKKSYKSLETIESGKSRLILRHVRAPLRAIDKCERSKPTQSIRHNLVCCASQHPLLYVSLRTNSLSFSYDHSDHTIPVDTSCLWVCHGNTCKDYILQGYAQHNADQHVCVCERSLSTQKIHVIIVWVRSRLWACHGGVCLDCMVVDQDSEYLC